MLLFCPCEGCYINDLRSILKPDEIMARWVCSFCGFCGEGGENDIPTAFCPWPCSTNQHSTCWNGEAIVLWPASQCLPMSYMSWRVSSKWIYVTLQAATPTSSWFLRPLCDTCSKQLPSQTTMDFKRHHASQSFDEFCMWKQNPTNYKHLSHLRFRVLEEFCWT